VKQYLRSEIDFAASLLSEGEKALELGCGYGRVCFRLALSGAKMIGIDSSMESLKLARRLAGGGRRCEFAGMDAFQMGFADSVFDAVICVQNGVCAIGADPEALLREGLRVTRSGGKVIFSTYSASFWPFRLEWFEAQSAEGLVGEIDRDKTAGGTIVCTDGLRLEMLKPEDLIELGSVMGLETDITEVDGSSVFGVWTAPGEE
ncbi:MAG: methyltransferase domain-containing protein, partial [Candidatus Latescibacteria bacterium]|nr:methyltransferase domain-containing protein [bacterium]MBD3425407.1 methyltransferase domain-containing protein [Candidatus Latescibacterota bacterium]